MPMHPPQLSPAMMNSPMAGMMPPAGVHMMPNHNMGMGMGMGM
eukprot:COSAG02_NODE_50677_length_319_cov_0.681818_1_plen_42_part_10